MNYEILVTTIIGILLIILGLIIRNKEWMNVRKLTIYELEDLEGYKKYLGRNFISAGIWLLFCVATKFIWTDIELIKVNLLTVLVIVFEYKMKAGNYMVTDLETGILRKRIEKK